MTKDSMQELRSTSSSMQELELAAGRPVDRLMAGSMCASRNPRTLPSIDRQHPKPVLCVRASQTFNKVNGCRRKACGGMEKVY